MGPNQNLSGIVAAVQTMAKEPSLKADWGSIAIGWRKFAGSAYPHTPCVAGADADRRNAVAALAKACRPDRRTMQFWHETSSAFTDLK